MAGCIAQADAAGVTASESAGNYCRPHPTDKSTNKSANRRGRLPGGLKAFGHTVRLLPPGYVKPYVKRQKACGFDDSADQTPVVQHRKVEEVD
jgi:hypothetical protein